MVQTLMRLNAGSPVAPSVALGLGAAATAAVVSYAIYKRYAQQQQELSVRGTVKRLFIYPIKSLPPVELKEVDFTTFGVKYKDIRDREFMLIETKPEVKFISARDIASLVLLHVEYNEAGRYLELTSNNPEVPMEPLRISLEPLPQNFNKSDLINVSTWKPHYNYNTLPLEEASAWFTKYIGKEVKLVRLVGLVGKRDPRIVPDHFYDTAPLNILSEKSVDNLVDLISDPAANISFRNFRPNVLVDVDYPFEEDFWVRTKIGDVETEFHSRCDRCIFTTINPDTGVKTLKEPLSTLRKFRVDRSDDGIEKYKHRPLISSHHVITKEGRVHVGQSIQAQRALRELL